MITLILHIQGLSNISNNYFLAVQCYVHLAPVFIYIKYCDGLEVSSTVVLSYFRLAFFVAFSSYPIYQLFVSDRLFLYNEFFSYPQIFIRK